MKRLLPFFLAAGLAALPAAAADFGFNLHNLSNLTGGDNTVLTQKDRLEAWVGGVGDNWAFRVGALYEFAGDFAANGTAVVPWRFDAGETYLYMAFPICCRNLASAIWRSAASPCPTKPAACSAACPTAPSSTSRPA